MMASEENITSLTEITGLKREHAETLLNAYDGNLEGAINAFFENPEGILNPEPPVVINDDEQDDADEDNVRAPIPRKMEVLLPQAEVHRSRLVKRRGATITEVPFRNFELEGRMQEQMLMQGEGPSSKKVTRLEALFMPPFDILFSGGFDHAQRHGRSVDRWVLVNLQDDLNFSCQTLNRDLWSDARLKDFMRRHFIFWQQSNKTTDGAKFKTFYKVHTEPYIGLIDPRTGEEVRNFSTSDLEPERFLATLKLFLDENKSPHGKEVNVQDYLLGGPSTSANGSKAPRPIRRSEIPMIMKNVKSLIELPGEEDEFEEITDSESEEEDDRQPFVTNAPVPTSLPSVRKVSTGSPLQLDSDTPPPVTTSEHATPTSLPVSTETDLSSDSESDLPAEQKTRIMLKMPGDVSERLFFRSSRTLKQTTDKLLEKYRKRFRNDSNFRPDRPVRFFCQAIKADLSTLDDSKTLLELKIHPNAVIHLTADD